MSAFESIAVRDLSDNVSFGRDRSVSSPRLQNSSNLGCTANVSDQNHRTDRIWKSVTFHWKGRPVERLVQSHSCILTFGWSPLIGEGKSLTDRELFQTIWMDWRRAMRARIHDDLEQIQSRSCERNEGHCWMRGKRIPFGWAKIWDLVMPWSGRVTFEIAWKLPEGLKRIQHSIPLGAESVAPMECSRWRLAGTTLNGMVSLSHHSAIGWIVINCGFACNFFHDEPYNHSPLGHCHKRVPTIESKYICTLVPKHEAKWFGDVKLSISVKSTEVLNFSLYRKAGSWPLMGLS
jgi:hypothetical protein